MNARRTVVRLTFAGVDISADINKHLLSLTYTDNEEDKTDDLQLSLDDREGVWLGNWLNTPGASKGVEISAVIVQKNWESNGKDRVLDCGVFEIDTVDGSGPPAKATIKAGSIPYKSTVRTQKKTKAWENYTLSGIAKEIAGKNGLTCMFESAFDPLYTRKEQIQESDITFLQRLCKAAGISLKVTAKIIVLFDAAAYEQKDAVRVIKRGTADVSSWSFSTSLHDASYSKCHVSYTDPTTGKTIEYCTNHRYNKQAARTAMIRAAADKNPPVYGFDCVCLIKGVLWGWNGNAAKPYGGAAYASNGVPDLGADTMITKCSGVSADFGGIVPGEAVWLPGHIGVYIGGGKVIECSPAFKNCVQVTACLNIGAISGMNGRKWTKHGKLPYITYDTAGGAQNGTESATKPSGTTTTPATLAFAVGDVVRFTGNTHYTNAAAASGAACKPGTAKVTALAKGAKHPYHLIKQPGGGSTVYGWVNVADVQAVGNGTTPTKMRVGAKVKYSGPLYRDSNGGGQGKTVNGTYTVKYYYPGRKCGVHIDGLGWVPESGCTVIG